MDGANGPKESTRIDAPVASKSLSVNVFTVPGKGYGRRAAKTLWRSARL
jgi:hypothetical protein